MFDVTRTDSRPHTEVSELKKRTGESISNASLMIHCAQNDVMYCSRAFCIKTNESFIMPGIANEYEIDHEKGDDFLAGTHDPKKFNVKKVYALCWN